MPATTHSPLARHSLAALGRRMEWGRLAIGVSPITFTILEILRFKVNEICFTFAAWKCETLNVFQRFLWLCRDLE